jgi:hypothetical protein
MEDVLLKSARYFATIYWNWDQKHTAFTLGGSYFDVWKQKFQ